MPQVVIAQKSPFPLDAEAGKKYAWCACGRSTTQPLCDGSHRGTGLAPVIFTADKSEKLWMCGCKHTKKPPFCDGSHTTL